MLLTVRSFAAGVLAFLLCFEMSFAQADPWDRVNQITKGDKISVKLLEGGTVNGKMEAWSTDELVVRKGENNVARMAKSDIARVSLVTGRSRARKAVYYGALFGSFFGVLSWMFGATNDVHNGQRKGIMGPISVGAVFGGIAAGIAAIFPAHKEVVYAR